MIYVHVNILSSIYKLQDPPLVKDEELLSKQITHSKNDLITATRLCNPNETNQNWQKFRNTCENCDRPKTHPPRAREKTMHNRRSETQPLSYTAHSGQTNQKATVPTESLYTDNALSKDAIWQRDIDTGETPVGETTTNQCRRRQEHSLRRNPKHMRRRYAFLILGASVIFVVLTIVILNSIGKII